MPPKNATSLEWDPFFMIKLMLIAGLMGIGFLILPDMEWLAFVVCLAVIGSLAASSQSFDERENQLLWKSYALAFQWSLIAVFFAYVIVMLLSWLSLAGALRQFFDTHWLALMISLMCILLGLAGVRVFRDEE